MNAIDHFRQALADAGIPCADEIKGDGELHRYKTGGDHAPNCWYVLHADEIPAGAFGCWKRGIKQDWCDKTKSRRDPTVQKKIAFARRKGIEEQIRANKHAALKAREILDQAEPASTIHSYLVGKGVKALGELRVTDGALIVPLRDGAGDLTSLQFIQADGTKRFLPGGLVKGSFFQIPGSATLVICEGYATAAAIHMATGFTVAAAMNCGNLQAVAEGIRKSEQGRDIIIAGDNDQWTHGNPGRSKAIVAARAIGAKVAVPEFGDTTDKPTDFNDLMRLAGEEEVRRQIQAAMPVGTASADPGGKKKPDTKQLEKKIVEVADLSPLEYEQARKGLAEEYGIRATVLDRQVAQMREVNKSAGGLIVPEVEPWPDPVNGAEVLNEVSAALQRYLALPRGAPDGIALWVAHAHVFDVFCHTPRLNVHSPEKGCGKTTTLDVVAVLVPRAVRAENISAAAIFRTIELARPTLLLDETDSYLRQNEEMRGVLNAGHKRGGQVIRCDGDDNEPKAFEVFAPAVLAGIGQLPGTLLDRSIVIRLTRAKPGEVRTRFDSRRDAKEQELCRKLARWALDQRDKLGAIDPDLPTTAFNRVADNWRPLFAIALVAGGAWLERARAAYDLLMANSGMDDQGVGVMLLTDIKEVFADNRVEKLFSRRLVEKLIDLDERPWSTQSKGSHPINTNWLGHHLRAFQIESRTIRIGDTTSKGYHLEQFQEVFERYLPDTPHSKRHTVTTPANKGETSISETSQPKSVLPLGNTVSANKDGHCDVVTVQKGGQKVQRAELDVELV